MRLRVRGLAAAACEGGLVCQPDVTTRACIGHSKLGAGACCCYRNVQGKWRMVAIIIAF